MNEIGVPGRQDGKHPVSDFQSGGLASDTGLDAPDWRMHPTPPVDGGVWARLHGRITDLRVRRARRLAEERRRHMRVGFFRSLSVRQALLAIVTTFLIGGVLSLFQIQGEAARERAKFADRTRVLLDLVQASAATAVWNLDSELATNVVSSALAMNGVQAVRLIEVPNHILASGTRPAADGDGHGFWSDLRTGALFNPIFADLVHVRRDLTRPARLPVAEVGDGLGDGGMSERDEEVIGRIEIDLDLGLAAADYIAFLRTMVIGGLVRDLVLGLVLTLLLHAYITRPLRAMGVAVARIDPQRPGLAEVPVARFHSQDELGFLAKRFNEALSLLERSRGDFERLATHDTLTGLPNRLLLHRRLTESLRRRTVARSGNRPLPTTALLFLDLDGFKHINDSLGHEVGDHFLVAVADRLAECLEPGDMLGRLGGDEFLIISEGAETTVDVAMLAERLLNAMEGTFAVDGRYILRGSLSVGVAIASEEAADATTLMRHADTALYAAKGAGRAQYRFFSREMSAHVENRLRIESSLRGALDAGSFEVHYQPKVRPSDRTMVGAEALVRWRRDGVLISPAEFMPIAEETGLIIELGAFVLEQAMRDAAHWTRLLPDFHIGVNVSPRQIVAPEFVDTVRDCLARHGVPPHRVELEVTESVLVDSGRSLETLRQLKALGVRIAVDDFGTGFSSLSYLRQMPIDCVKIDRAFVQDIPQDSAIAAMVLTLGDRLGLEVVAEGVETEEQLGWLMKEGCPVIQGFLVSRPIPAREFETTFVFPAAAIDVDINAAPYGLATV